MWQTCLMHLLFVSIVTFSSEFSFANSKERLQIAMRYSYIAYNVVAIGCGTRAYDIVGQTYNIVCKHMVSMFKTTSYVSLQYRIPDMLYCMSKYVPSTAYDIE